MATQQDEINSVPAAVGDNLFRQSGKVTAAQRALRYGQRPATVWLTGLSGAGKSSIAYALEALLFDARLPVYVLDGDNLRRQLNSDLDFSAQARKENIRRSAEVARMMNDAGLMVVAAFISPYRADRAMAAQIIGADDFIEVHVSTPVAVCEARDAKGLYARARAGQVADFTGVSAPYETPLAPALSLDTGSATLEHSARSLLRHLAPRFN